MKLGNLVTYKGKSLAKAKTKALNGNLVFAEITEGDDKGFYIFAGGAEGHMVNKADFDSFKADAIARIEELERLTDMPQNAETGKEMTVTEYVAAQIAALQLGDASKKGVAAGVTADEEGLTTGAQVYNHVSGAVATLESSISGVVGSLEDYVLKASVKDSFDGAADGDVASVGAVKSYVSGIVGDELGSAAYENVAAGVTADEAGLTTGAQVYAHVSGEIAAANAYADSLVKDTDGNSLFDAAGSAAAAEAAAKKYTDDEIGKLGTVMSFIGVVELAEGQTFDTTNATVTINGVDKTAENGDVVIVGDKEYVWDGTSWKEFGDASAEGAAISELEGRVDTLEATVSGNVAAIATNSGAIAALQEGVATNSGAIAALSSTIGAIAGENAIGFDGEKITLKLATGDKAGNVALTQDEDGLKADITLPTAETLAYTAETLEGESKPTTEATNVKDALDDLFKSDKVASAAINDLNSKLDTLSGTVGEITTTVEGDAASYSVVEGDFATGFTVKNTLAAAGTAGLATDAYVKETVEAALTWEVLTDADGE